MDNAKLFVVDDQMDHPITLKKLHELNDLNEMEIDGIESLEIGETCNLFFAPVKRIK